MPRPIISVILPFQILISVQDKCSFTGLMCYCLIFVSLPNFPSRLSPALWLAGSPVSRGGLTSPGISPPSPWSLSLPVTAETKTNKMADSERRGTAAAHWLSASRAAVLLAGSEQSSSSLVRGRSVQAVRPASRKWVTHRNRTARKHPDTSLYAFIANVFYNRSFRSIKLFHVMCLPSVYTVEGSLHFWGTCTLLEYWEKS